VPNDSLEYGNRRRLCFHNLNQNILLTTSIQQLVLPNSRRISKRFDPQAKTGSAIAPTIRLGPHSRKRPNCVDISPRGPLQGPKTPCKSAIFTKHSCD
jgi:hypothetical protein